MRILEFNEKYSESGGQGRYFLEMIDALRERGHDVYGCGFADRAEHSEKKLVFKDTNNFFLRQVKRFVFDLPVYLKLRGWIKKINPDVIHLHGINKSTLSILLACRGYRTAMSVQNYALVCPTIWCVYQDDLKVCEGGVDLKCVRHKCISIPEFLIFMMHFRMRKYLLDKNVDVFMPSSKTLEGYMKKHGFDNVVYQPNFIEVEKIVDTSEMEKDIDLLYVGRINREKGVHTLVNAMKLIVKENPKAKLYIIGDGPEKEKLEGVSKGVSNDLNLGELIIFVGRVPFDKLKEYYARAKILVIPSIYMDNAPLVCLYAMANGIPMIGSDRGGIPEFCIHEKTGLIFESTNVDDLYEKIITLLGDDGLRERLGKSGGDYIQDFEKKNLVESFEDKLR